MKKQTVLPAAAAGAAQTSEPAGFINEAVILGRLPVCRRTLKAWRDAGKIPFAKIGKRVLYHWPSVEQALLRMQRGGVA